MPLQVTCSGCQATLAAPDTAAGKAVRCPKCQAVVRVPAPAGSAPPAGASITSGANGPPPRKPAAPEPEPVEILPEEDDGPSHNGRTEEDDEDRPRRKRGGDDKPRRKRDEEEPAPVRRRPAAAVKKGDWIFPVTLGAVLLGVFVFCGLGGWGVYKLFSSISEQVAQNNPPGGPPFNPGAGNPPPNPNPGGPPFNPGPGAPFPGNPLPGDPPKPADVLLKMPPLPEAVPIKPPALKGETAYNLPDTIGALAVGGGGRFLVLHFPKLRKLGVFDVNEAKVTQFIPVGEDDVHFAAGMTKLVVYLPGSNTVQRWDLVAQQREHVGKLPGDREKLSAFCMGHASAGPLLVCDGRAGVRFYDISTFEEMPYRVDGQGIGQGPGALYWAGADGRIFGATGNYGQPSGVATLVIEGGKVRTHRQHWGAIYVQPGPDARHICTCGDGVLTDRVETAADAVFSRQNGQIDYTFVPAHHGPYYLHLHLKTGLRNLTGTGINKDDPEWGVSVYLLGEKRPIAQRGDVRVPTYGEFGALRGLGIERCVHLVPRANLIAVVPASRDRLLLYPFDVEEALEKSGAKFLLVTSQPPASVKRGQALTYQMTGKAKGGGLTFKLESGPTGMTVTPQGQLSWPVPADFAEKEADVIVTARAAGGQEAFHTFTVSVQDP